jgi:hypothetical protein
MPVMSLKTAISWLGAIVSSAIAAVVLYYVLNQFIIMNGAGVLKRLDWPLSESYFWGIVGGLAGAVGRVLTSSRRRVHALQVAEAAQLMRLDYYATVSREDLGAAGQLPLFGQWESAAHRLAGRIDHIQVQMLDYTYREKGDDGSNYYTQTVVLLPGADHLPAFELRPRNVSMRVLGMLGIKGITFDPAAAGPDATVIEQFQRRYHLWLGLEREMKKLAEQVHDLAVSDATAGAEEAVRKLFTLDMLHFFAEHPGWYVESNSQHLALWRRKTIVRGPDRPQFLTEALEVRNTVADKRPAARSTAIPAVQHPTEPLMVPARLAGTALGLVAGFLTGGFWFMFFLDPFRPPGAFHLGFFGTILSCLLVGGVVGNRLLPRPLLWWLRRRHARERQAIADSPWRQPLASTAQVEERGDQLIIALPARGLVGVTGAAAFLWCTVWNLIVVVFTVLWVPAVIRGQIQGPGGNPPALLACLFLVPFWLVGIISLLVMLNHGRRRAIIIVDSDHLWCEETTLFRVKRREWRRDQLASVKAASPSGDAFGRKMELCLTPRQGDPTRLLSWRNQKEVRWLAGLIREKWHMAS